MKRLALSLLIITAAVKADVTLPFVAFHNNNSQGNANASAIYSLNSGTSEQVIGSFEYPVLSDNGSLTVATYIPVAPSKSGLSSETDSVTWRYSLSGLNDNAFRGMYCPSCSGGFKDPMSVSNTELVLPYNPLSSEQGFVSLTMSSSFFNYLLGMGAGQSETISTSAFTAGSSVAASSQRNILQKLGDYNLDNSAHFDFAIDPITGDVNIKSSITGQRCIPYQYIALKGLLCDVMKYTYQGSSISSFSGSLSLAVSKVNPLLSQFQGKGLNVSLTFDEKNWYDLSNGSVGTPSTFADSFLQAPIKTGGNANLKMFFPNDFIKAVALEGKASDLTEIATLCLNKPLAQIGADFCFHPGKGISITPVEPSIEIKPDNPDYTLDPTGFGATGKGKIGDNNPITIPYSIYTTSKDPAITVTARITGVSKQKLGKDYCVFGGIGKLSNVTVPVPGDVSVGLTHSVHEHNCTGVSFDIPSPSSAPGEWLKQVSPISSELNVWKTPLILEFPMNDPISEKTYDGSYWDGIVSSQGTIEVTASWN
uniref:receptor n=1 Tax=Hafnia alvei TaxID=569 RepID=UPI0024328D28|nr:receptor [Hafnia alvei]